MKVRAAGPAAAVCAMLLSSCDLAPTYDPPRPDVPVSYQGTTFRAARPDAVLSPSGNWWTLFGDAELNLLEEQLEHANPTLQAAAEQYTQARDLAAEAQSALYPQFTTEAQSSQNKQSSHRLFRARSTVGHARQASQEITGTASWEPDFWDAIHNSANQQKRLAQASAADLATARLLLEAELATDYIGLRGLDAQLEVLRQSIVAYKLEVEVTGLRAKGHIASELDLARALSNLGAAEAQQSDTELQREVMQHAIAVLVGAMPSRFTIAPVNELKLTPPQIPAGLPSELLERRPDVASAERQMAAANALIGVSRAAFYPNVTFNATGGFQDIGINLASLSNSLWAVGATAMLPLFQGGLRRAELQHSWSQYSQASDDYRATVLAAFQEVEDGLSETQRLAAEVKQQQMAADEAEKALSISTMLYKDGLDNYLSVAVAQVQALAAQTLEVQVQTRQLQAAVTLVRALGGGWTVKALPSEEQTLPFGPFDFRSLSESP